MERKATATEKGTKRIGCSNKDAVKGVDGEEEEKKKKDKKTKKIRRQ